eukprot:229667-Amorphochlora_amoeboformis.AAC.1
MRLNAVWLLACLSASQYLIKDGGRLGVRNGARGGAILRRFRSGLRPRPPVGRALNDEGPPLIPKHSEDDDYEDDSGSGYVNRGMVGFVHVGRWAKYPTG